VTRLCHDTNVGATCVRSGLRPQIPFLPLVQHSSKKLDVFRTLARVPERSKYRKAACRPDAKWSATAGRPTSPHLNRNSSPVRFSAVSNGHFLSPRNVRAVCTIGQFQARKPVGARPGRAEETRCTRRQPLDP